MKRIIYLLFIFMFLSGITYAGVINFYTPALNSEWCINKPNQPLQIRWVENPKENEFVKIRLYNSDLTVQVFKIVDSTENDGVFDWVIPASIQPGKYRIRVRSLNNLASGDSAVFTIKNCSASTEIFIAKGEIYRSPPDLKITMFCNPDSPGIDQESEIEFKVKNIGGKDSAPCSMRIMKNNVETDKWDVPIIKPGRHFAVTKEFIPKSFDEIFWFAEVDGEQVSGDTKFQNNFIRKTMLIGRPDLKITKMFSPDQKNAIGEKCILRIEVRNIGHSDSGNFEIDCDWDFCPLIARGRKFKSHEGLKPGESAIFEFTHRYTCDGLKEVVVHVNKGDKVPEENYANNKRIFLFLINIHHLGTPKEPKAYNF